MIRMTNMETKIAPTAMPRVGSEESSLMLYDCGGAGEVVRGV